MLEETLGYIELKLKSTLDKKGENFINNKIKIGIDNYFSYIFNKCYYEFLNKLFLYSYILGNLYILDKASFLALHLNHCWVLFISNNLVSLFFAVFILSIFSFSFKGILSF